MNLEYWKLILKNNKKIHMSKIKQKAGRKKIDPSKVKKNVAVYRDQIEIDEHGGIDNLKEKINYFIENLHPIKFDPSRQTRTNIITMQKFITASWDNLYISGTYEGSETSIKIPINIFETFFR